MSDELNTAAGAAGEAGDAFARPEVGPDAGGADEHARWEDLMVAALDGRADPAERAQLDRHVASCPDCATAYAEYGRLFGSLREAAVGERPTEFWDSLAAGVEQRIAAERTSKASVGGDRPGGPTRDEEPDPSRQSPVVIDLAERTSFRAGRMGVAGGLVAAGIAVLVLAGLYLRMPRTGGEPEAFTTALREPAIAESEPGEEPTDSEELALEADLSLLAVERDPLADLADLEDVLEGLTSDEAEELLLTLEAQT